MLGALIIVFREVIEAGLIVGIVLAVTQGIPRRGFWIAGGVGAGLLGAVLVAIFADVLAHAMAGVGQELFNAGILLIAVAMLAWHNIWMARHGRQMAQEFKSLGNAVAQGSSSMLSLAVVVSIAVLREGAEVVLFLYSIVAAGGTNAAEILSGSLMGLVLGAVVSAMTFWGLVHIPARYLFGVTTTLITFLAAGLAGQSIVFLQQAGFLAFWQDTLWDTSSVLSDTSLFGRVLHTLVGYSDQPSGLQVVAYAVTLLAILSLTRLCSPRPAAGPNKRVVGAAGRA